MRYRECLQKKHQVTRLCMVFKRYMSTTARRLKLIHQNQNKWKLIAKIEPL